MTQVTEVSILLATYNGEKYIEAQIESIIKQTYNNWKLYIRDDGSSDNTLSIIEKYEKIDKRVMLISNESGNLGSCQNFSRLISYTIDKGLYFMFCDQDDVWMPSKIEGTLLQMLGLEDKRKTKMPLLVYTNFQYVDKNLQVIEAMKNYKSTKVAKLCFSHLLAQNPAYGCTMMLNKRLAEIVGIIPKEAENHDYWVALVASAFGEIYYIDKPTILYRQHDSNASTNYDDNSLVKRFKRIVFRKEIFADIENKMKIAAAFKSIYFSLISDKNKTILNDFINLGKKKNISLVVTNILNGVRRQTISQTILFYTCILLRKGQ